MTKGLTEILHDDHIASSVTASAAVAHCSSTASQRRAESTMMIAKPKTFSKFLLESEDASGSKCAEGIKTVLKHVALSAKIIANVVQRAGLHGLYGEEGLTNSSGEQQQKLDVIANEIFIDTMKDSGSISLMISEENSEAIFVDTASDEATIDKGEYAIVFDPLDGSSNIECQVAVGTIFGIYRVKNAQDPCVERDILGCSGRDMIAAGYILYSSSVNFVMSTGADVNCFTLDPQFGEFILTKKNLTIPDSPKTIYSVNEGRQNHWNQAVKEFVDWCKMKNYTHRYIGSMVGDVHRTLIYGGIFFYPAEKNKPHGKLRTLYECFPMAFLVEKAGGYATNGCKRILDLEPKDIHERTPIFLGCRRDCLQLASIIQFCKSDNAGSEEYC